MGSAGNKRYSSSSYIHSVLQFSCFSPAADLCKWEGITPEQRPRAEQGQKCTQRHYRTIASASSTGIFQKCKEKDLLILSRGQEHSASHNRAIPCPHVALMHSPPSPPCLTSCGIHPATPPTAVSAGRKRDWQELVDLIGECVKFFLLLLCVDWGIGNATKGVGLNPPKQCLSTLTCWEQPHSLCKTVLSTSQ